MKAVIFAGGKGERLSYYTESIPKPMIELDGIPLIIRLMNYCSKFGIDEFVILGGYKCNYIKRYLYEFALFSNNLTIELLSSTFDRYCVSRLKNRESILSKNIKKIHIVDCGIHDENCTAQDLLLAEDYIEKEKFLILYGDTLADVNIEELKEFHEESNSFLTISVTHSREKNGNIEFEGNGKIRSFLEKGTDYNKHINIGFMICDFQMFSYIENTEHKSLELQIIPELINKKNVTAFYHNGHYQAFDTLKDINNFDGKFM